MLLIPKIPSAHRSGKYYPVVVLYKPADQQNNYVGANHRLGYQGEQSVAPSQRTIVVLSEPELFAPVPMVWQH